MLVRDYRVGFKVRTKIIFVSSFYTVKIKLKRVESSNYHYSFVYKKIQHKLLLNCLLMYNKNRKVKLTTYRLLESLKQTHSLLALLQTFMSCLSHLHDCCFYNIKGKMFTLYTGVSK